MALELKGYSDDDLLTLFVKAEAEWSDSNKEHYTENIRVVGEAILERVGEMVMDDVDPEYHYDKYDEATRIKLEKHCGTQIDRIYKLLKLKHYEHRGEELMSFDEDKVVELFESKRNEK